MDEFGDEFGLIARHLAPLAGEGALGLLDDVGVLDGLAVTKDLIACGTHFLPDDPPGTVGWKAIAVNASDLIAKGCRPVAALVGVAWPRGTDEAAFAAFARGLGDALSAYGATLLGGDTTRHRGAGPLTVSVTMIGRPIGEAIVPRSGARAGDAVFVLGPIGEAGFGLAALTSEAAGGPDAASLVAAYRTPRPPLAAARLVAEHASASIDVSDGLIADARRLARASGLRVVIGPEVRAALSPAVARLTEEAGDPLRPLTAGDDYVPLVAVPPAGIAALATACAEAGVPAWPVGRCEAGTPDVALLDERGAPVPTGLGGYAHF